MIRLLKLLFNGKKTVNVSDAIDSHSVDPDRAELTKQLREIDRSYKKIYQEGQNMKRKIDTALAIAISTGGLR